MLTYVFDFDYDRFMKLCKNQVRKSSEPLVIVSTLFSVLLAVFIMYCILADSPDFIIFIICFACLTAFGWTRYSVVRRRMLKYSEKYFKYYNVGGVVQYGYEFKEDELIVTQPLLGNVNHYKYDMIIDVKQCTGDAIVILATRQYLPIAINDDTLDLVYELKSRCGSK